MTVAQPDSLPIAVVRQVVDTLRGLGVDARPALQACGISETALRDPEARIEATQEHAFWASLEAHAGTDAFGLRVGASYGRVAEGSLQGYLVRYAPTLRAAIASADRFASLTDPRGRVALRETAELASVHTFRDNGAWRAPGYIESLLVAFSTLAFQHVEGFCLEAVRLRRAPPRHLQAFVDSFGVRPEFGAEYNELVFPRALLDVPNVAHDPGLSRLLTEHADTLLSQMPRTHPLLRRIQVAVLDDLGHRETSMATVARRLGMSPRTLHRRLAAVGTRFQVVVDDVRRNAACHRLQYGDDTVEEICHALGFASTSAFQRAFRRWTGMTPMAFRTRNAQHFRAR